jgi:spermidine synthase
MRKSVLFSLILLGVTAVSGQIILIREFFTIFYGNELSVGVILAIWLFGGSIGSGLLGGLFVDKIKGGHSLFSFIQILLSFLIPAGVIFARISRPAFGVGAGEIVSLPVFVISSLTVLLPITIALGFLFVLGCKMMPQGSRSESIGRVYTLETIGAAIGGAITGLILIRYFGALHIALALSGLNLLASVFLLAGERGMRKRALPVAGPILLLSALALFTISGGINSLDRKSLEANWRPFRVLESRDSVYGRTTVTENASQLNFFNNGLFLFSSHDLLTAEETVHFPMASHPGARPGMRRRPQNALLIGGGGSEIMSEILKYPLESVDYVELDPLIIASSKKFLRDKPFYRLEDRRVTIKEGDGRYFIKNTGKLYDVIIVNMPNPHTAQINRFYTAEFFKEAKRIMAEGAILSFSVSSSENYISAEQALFLKTIFETAKAQFAEVEIIPGDTAYFLCADKKGALSLEPEKMEAALKKRRIDTVYVRDYYLLSKLSKERRDFLYSAVHSKRPPRKNLDFHPICYFYDMILWSTHFNFKLAKFFMFLTGRRLLVFTMIGFLVLFAFFFARRRNKNFRKEATLVALCTTGLSEIAFQILIVLAFQIIYGYLYYKIGLIVTSFMFGLGLGSSYITRRLAKISHPFKTYTRIQVLVFIYPIVLAACFRIFALLAADPAFRHIVSGLFAALPFVAGFAGGMQFPLANKICLAENSPAGKTAGTSYAVDLLGSLMGAILLSAFFVPLLGIPLTCVLVAALNGLSLALLLAA